MLGHVDFMKEIIRQELELAEKLRHNYGRYTNNNFNAIIFPQANSPEKFPFSKANKHIIS